MDHFKPNPNNISSIILLILMLMALAWIIMEVCMRLQGALILRTMPLIRDLAREKLLERIKTYPYEYFPSKMTGHIVDHVLSSARGIESLLHISLITFVPISALFLFSLIILWSIHPPLSLIIFSWMLTHFIITWKMSKTSLLKSTIFAQAKSVLHGKIVDMIANVFTIQTFCRQAHEKSYLETFQHKEILAEQDSLHYLEKIKLYLGISGIVILIFTLIYSYVGWLSEVISTGDMTFIIVLLLNMTGYLWYMSMEAVKFLEEFGIIKENLNSLFNVKSNQNIYPEKLLEVTKGSLSIRNLSFRYTSKTPVLNEINFSINSKEKIALTGLSGSGKTTLINLILGHLSLQQGDIFIDDLNIRELSPDNIREQISIVPQNPGLFHRSIKENISYGKLNADEQEIIAAAKLAGCHQFILNLDQGYDTLVGEKGDKLSGGQKQRIAIARAILKNTPILILDEPTSSLDVKTEEQFISNLFDHIQHKTMILITHRVSISARFDRIVRI